MRADGTPDTAAGMADAGSRSKVARIEQREIPDDVLLGDRASWISLRAIRAMLAAEVPFSISSVPVLGATIFRCEDSRCL